MKVMHLFKNIFSLLKTAKCNCPIFLGGKTALVTGGSSGIGLETAKILASRGAKVIVADRQNLEETRNHIIRSTHNEKVEVKCVDLSSLQSVRDLAEDIKANEKHLDILVNNAGVGGLIHRYTDDLLQEEMQINHFGPFLLTYLLIDLLKKSRPSRIIFVSSILAYMNNLTLQNLNTISGFPVADFAVYSNSKLCNIITARGFAERLRNQGVTCNSLHPGLVVSNLYQNMRGENSFLHLKKIIYFLLHIGAKIPTLGAQTTIHLALSDEVQNVTGKFFMENKPFVPPQKALDKSFCESIWKASENFVQLRPYEKLKSPVSVHKKTAGLL